MAIFSNGRFRNTGKTKTLSLLVCYHTWINAEWINAEPVVMVPSFLTMSEMRKPNRQIILGLITDMERKSSAAKYVHDRGSPCLNYHAQLSLIHDGLLRIQKRGGLWMRLRIHGIKKVVKLILPVLMIKGDAKSQDNIAGRYASHHPSVGRLVWQCDCTPREARYPWTKCNYLFKDPIHLKSLRALGLDKEGNKEGNSSQVSSGQEQSPTHNTPIPSTRQDQGEPPEQGAHDPWREPVCYNSF